MEDSEDVLEMLQIQLEDMGYEIIPAGSGEAALAALAADTPHIIVSDLGLPGISGLELIQQIRKMPALSLVPAIALTGSSMDRDVQRALAAGFTAHLTKPVEAADLGHRIEQLTSLRLERKAS